MNIFTDGARSRKRLSVAKKAVAKLTALGGSKKIGVYEGFTYKVTKDGRGWIKAPFGIYVVLSDDKGIRQFTCDSVGSPALPYFDKTAKDRYVLMPGTLPAVVPFVPPRYITPPYPGAPAEDYPQGTGVSVVVAGSLNSQTLLFAPKTDVYPVPYNTIPYQPSAPTPVVMPVGAENVALRLSYGRDSKHNVDTTQVTHCYNKGQADAENVVKSLTITSTYAATQGLEAGRDKTYRVPLHASAGRWGEVWWKPGFCWSGPRLLVMVYPDLRTNTYDYYVQNLDGLLAAVPDDQPFRISSVLVACDTTTDVNGVMPEETIDRRKQVRAVVILWQGIIFLDYTNGHASRSREYMAALLTPATNTGDLWWTYPYYTMSWRTDYPRLRGVYSFTGWFPTATGILAGDYWVVSTGGTVLIPSPPDPPLEYPIYSLSVVEAVVDNAAFDNPAHWIIGDNVTRFVTKGTPTQDADRQLFVNETALLSLAGRHARSNDSVSFNDSESFPDAQGVIHTWMRITDPNAAQNIWGQAYSGTRSGGFKLTHASGGFTRVPLYMPDTVATDIERHPAILLMTATTYVCLTKSWDNIIHNIHVGSPFSPAWLPVDMPAAAVMYSVRVTTPGNTVDECGFIGIGKVTGEDYEYFIFFKPPGEPWARVSPIPLVDLEHVEDAVAAWDVCVFGDDAIVGNMLSCKQHPISRPEMPGKHR